MKRTFIYSTLAFVAGLTSALTVAAQQPASKEVAPKASAASADRVPRDIVEPADPPPRPPGQPRRDPRESFLNGPRGEPRRPDVFPNGSPYPGGPPGGMPGHPPGPYSYRVPQPADPLEELKKFDPEMYELEKKDMELEKQSFDLGQQYRRAPRDQRDTLKVQLQEVVQKHFDARQARRQLQLKRLEEELNRMRSAMEHRTDSRVQIVERRVVELIGERSDLDF